MSTTPRQADDFPPLPPPRWRAPRGPRGCGGNLVLVAVGLFGIIAAFCIFSGGFVDWAIRKALSEQETQVEQAPLFGSPPPPRLPVRQGLRDDTPARRVPDAPGASPDAVAPDRPGAEEAPKGKGVDEDALFGVQ